MAGYVKLFDSMLDSTIWETPPPVKVVWVTMLMMADRDGYVGASVPGLAKRAGVERAECERALALFLAPDIDSRTKDNDGRRIDVADGGWLVLNYEAYRDRASMDEKRAKDAARQRRKYDRDKAAASRAESRTSRVSLTALTEPHQTSPLISAASASAESEASQPNPQKRSAGFEASISSEVFGPREAAAVFSRLRVARKRGSFKLKTSQDFERADAAAATAREDSPADPEAFCARGVTNFLEHASGKEADGWPFWGWANDPGKWAAYVPTESQRGPSRVCSAEEHANDPGEF